MLFFFVDTHCVHSPCFGNKTVKKKSHPSGRRYLHAAPGTNWDQFLHCDHPPRFHYTPGVAVRLHHCFCHFAANYREPNPVSHPHNPPVFRFRCRVCWLLHPASFLWGELVTCHWAPHVFAAIRQEASGWPGVGQQQRQRHDNLTDARRCLPAEPGSPCSIWRALQQTHPHPCEV
jgi:hypothetical protein